MQRLYVFLAVLLTTAALASPARAEDWVYLPDPDATGAIFADLNTVEVVVDEPDSQYRRVRLTFWVMFPEWLGRRGGFALRQTSLFNCGYMIYEDAEQIELYGRFNTGLSLIFEAQIVNSGGNAVIVPEYHMRAIDRLGALACGSEGTGEVVHLDIHPVRVLNREFFINLVNNVDDFATAAHLCFALREDLFDEESGRFELTASNRLQISDILVERGYTGQVTSVDLSRFGFNLQNCQLGWFDRDTIHERSIPHLRPRNEGLGRDWRVRRRLGPGPRH